MTDEDLGARGTTPVRRKLTALLPALVLAAVLVVVGLVVGLHHVVSDPSESSDDPAGAAGAAGTGVDVPAQWKVSDDLCDRLDLPGAAKASALSAPRPATGQVRPSAITGSDFTCRLLASGATGAATGPVTIAAGGTLYSDTKTADTSWEQAVAASKRPGFDGLGKKATSATKKRDGWWQEGTELDVTHRSGAALVRVWVRQRGLVAWVSVTRHLAKHGRDKGLAAMRALADRVLQQLPGAAA